MWSEGVRCIETPVGRLTLRSEGAAICAVEFGGDGMRMDDAPVLLLAERELMEYFAGRRRAFSVPLCIRGTAFRREVWQALMEIP